MNVDLRPPRLEDAGELAAAADEFGRVKDGDRISPAEVETWLATPSIDLERDACVAVLDGRIVGYADVFDSSREGKLLWLLLLAHPAHSEACPALLNFAEARAAELAKPGGLVRVAIPEKATDLRAVLESHGFVADRFSFRMMASLEGNLAEPEWPQGISVRSFQGEGDERAIYELHQETFSDLEDRSPVSFEDWRHWSLRDGFDPELWFLAGAEGELQGVALCRASWDNNPSLGWVSVLGVRRPWRGRGLGLALLRHAFRELRTRGKTQVGLGVDAENATGAVRLYERAGMQVIRRRISFKKAVA